MLASGEKVSIDQGIKLVEERYAERATLWLRTRFPGIPLDELPGVWNEALWQLALRARRGQFTTNGGLGKLLLKMLFFRAVDWLRQHLRKRPCQELLDEVELIAQLIRPDERMLLEELFATIREAIGSLSKRQRAVWEAYADLGFDRTDEDLVAEASIRAGEQFTEQQVRRSLQAGKKKVIENLYRRGYLQ